MNKYHSCFYCRHRSVSKNESPCNKCKVNRFYSDNYEPHELTLEIERMEKAAACDSDLPNN